MTKVLVVDDTPDTAMLLARAVREQGYEALIANDGLQALRLAATEPFDAILLDIMMPRMNGIEVLRRLNSDPELQAIPVLLVTAKTDDSSVVEGLDAGAYDYILKPFRREILAARLRARHPQQAKLRLAAAGQSATRQRDRRATARRAGTGPSTETRGRRATRGGNRS